mgnify:CR=1 FL=1
MLTQQRHEIILKLLKEKGSITVTEVRDLLDTSESTVRRDITALDKEGKLEKVFGGAVPKNFFPAVEKGLRDCTAKGVLAGYPMVGIKATLVDGSYHPVDSSEMSFKMAAAVAFKDGIPQASPVLLEPIGTLKVLVPDEMLGDVIGDINKRRGRIIGMNPAENKMQEIIGEVPMAEMSDFSTAMRSITQGTAVFTLTPTRYEEVPAALAQKIIDAAKE